MASTVVESDGVTLLSQPAATYGPFRLAGGQYSVDVNSAGAGTATINRVLADGTTVAVTAALAGTSPGSHTIVTVPPGMVQIVIATAACDVAVARVHQF
jgi:hypothetical protein